MSTSPIAEKRALDGQVFSLKEALLLRLRSLGSDWLMDTWMKKVVLLKVLKVNKFLL